MDQLVPGERIMSEWPLAAGRDTSAGLPWPNLLERATAIVSSYDTPVTLRQLFYWLVAAQRLANTSSAYKALSRYTVRARRTGSFPTLMERGRTIQRFQSCPYPTSARRWALRDEVASPDDANADHHGVGLPALSKGRRRDSAAPEATSRSRPIR
jgi:hypothetical protein